MKQYKKGKVIFAGAGPGDPDLLTIKAARYLGKADVVLTDRLVSEEILKTYVNPDAEIIYVGKQCRSGVSTLQQDINHMLASYAMEGKLVIRLKGGDVSVFSNILDELKTVIENNIPYEIIPGITAAMGASAYAGIPLTARGYATGVRFLTCYQSDVVANDYWQDLANTNDTLVFYMSSETVPLVVEKLTSNHIHPSKLLAVVEQATTPLQKVHVYNLYECENLIKRTFISPSIVIIGKVVILQHHFKWLANSKNDEYYFTPLSNPAIIKPGKAKTNVTAI